MLGSTRTYQDHLAALADPAFGRKKAVDGLKEYGITIDADSKLLDQELKWILDYVKSLGAVRANQPGASSDQKELVRRMRGIRPGEGTFSEGRFDVIRQAAQERRAANVAEARARQARLDELRVRGLL